MPAAALEAEVNAYMAESADQRHGKGHPLVVRNGFHQPRTVSLRPSLPSSPAVLWPTPIRCRP